MYKELEKYNTKNKIEGTGTLPDGQKIKIYNTEYSMGLGDLMEDYFNHLSKPRWRRNYYHNHLSSIYKKVLNKVKITETFF